MVSSGVASWISSHRFTSGNHSHVSLTHIPGRKTDVFSRAYARVLQGAAQDANLGSEPGFKPKDDWPAKAPSRCVLVKLPGLIANAVCWLPAQDAPPTFTASVSKPPLTPPLSDNTNSAILVSRKRFVALGDLRVSNGILSPRESSCTIKYWAYVHTLSVLSFQRLSNSRLCLRRDKALTITQGYGRHHIVSTKYVVI